MSFSIPVFHSVSEAYLAILKDVYENPDHVHEDVTPEMMKDHENKVTQNPHWYFNKAAKQEKINYHFVIEKPLRHDRILTHSQARNHVIYEYSSKETVLFDQGDRTNIKTLSKVWERIQNPDGTINANYGYMVYHLKDAGNECFDPDHFMSQWEWAKNRMLLKKCTNQAYVHFNRPKDQWVENLDQPCTLSVQFFIRNDELHLNINMRSNDVIYGFPYNSLYFIELMHRMVDELKPTYTELQIGNFYYNSVSLHLYRKHLSKAKDMLGV